MALKDCIKKLGKALSDADTELLQTWIDQGLTDDQVLDRYELHIDKTLVDITKRAQDKGAKVSVKRDVLAEVKSFGEARLARAQRRLAEVREEHTMLNQQYGEITWVEGNIKNWEPGGPSIDIYNDGELAVRFRQMLFIHKDAFRRGEFGDNQIKGNNASELVDSFRAMQARGDALRAEMFSLFEQEVELVNEVDDITGGTGTLDPETGEYRVGPVPPASINELKNIYVSTAPWKLKTGKDAEGDLYIQRVGPNAGTPHRTRQGPSDMAISFNQELLLTDYMFYLMQYLAPQMQARAHGTAQQAINKRDIEEVMVQHFRNQAREDTGDFYADNQPATPELVRDEAMANYKAIVRVQEEREIATGITKVTSAADAAHVLAEIRRNASEGFWALVLDADDNVIGVVEHGRGTIDGTSVYPSTYAGAIHTIPGAAKVWMAHNHPSGVLERSEADRRITGRISALLDGSGIEVQGHVLLGGSQSKFTLMNKDGDTVESNVPITPAARTQKVKVFTRKLVGKQDGPTIRSPAETKAILERMGNPEGVLLLNNRHKVLGFLSMTAEEMKTLKGTGGSHRLIKALAETNAAAFIVSLPSVNPDAANNMANFSNASDWRMLDAMYKQNGQTESMASAGTLGGQGDEFYQTVPGLRSGVLTAAQTLPQKKGPVDQMMALLKKQPGVTPAEMDWLMLEEYFVARGGVVTQDEIIAFVRENGIVLEETMYGGQIVPEPEITTELIEVDQVYEKYGLDFADRHNDGTLIYSAVDYHSQFDYDILIDMQTETASITPDGGVTWLDLTRPAPVMQAHRDKHTAILAAAEALVERDVKERQRGQYSGPSFFANTDSVLDGGTMDREILLRTPKVDTGDVVLNGNLVQHGQVAWTDDYFDEVQTDVMDASRVGDVELTRITNDNGVIIQIMYENLAPENYSDFADMMVHFGIQMQDEDSNIATVKERLEDGDAKTKRQIENYEAGHWDKPNVIAWIRTTDRLGPNGERILFVEETQSDIHQAASRRRSSGPRRGERIGYREGVEVAPLVKEILFHEASSRWYALDENGNRLRYFGADVSVGGADSASRAAVWQNLENQIDNRRAERLGEEIDKQPQMPFKGNAWVTLVMKRMIRMAAENGYDQISWTTGEQQVIRNAQGTATGDIEWNPTTGALTIWNIHGNIEKDLTGVDLENLSEHIEQEQIDHLMTQVNEKRQRYDIYAGVETDLIYEPSELAWAADAPMEGYTGESLKAMAEQGDLFTAVDVNGEYIRDPYGSIIIATTKQEMTDYIDEVNFPETDLPKANGGGRVVPNEQGEGSISFYDKNLPRLTQKAARKLDKKAEVRLFGTEIHTRDGAPFTVELKKVMQAGSTLPGVDWFLVNYEGRQVAGPFESEARAKAKRDELNDITETVHVMDVTEDMKLAAMENQTFYQNKKGAISFDEARRGVIKMTESRDLSTFLHEAGHLYLEIMRNLAEDENTPQAVKDDFAKMMEFLGVGEDGVITRAQHEKWAESFEKYLSEGNAPSVALQSAFNAFRRWLKDIWKRIKGDTPDGIALTPEIRDVMDRILASDDQIQVANATQHFAAIFSTAEEMGVSQRVFDAYKQNILKANNEAIEDETRRLMAAANRAARVEWREEKAKVRAEVEAEVHEQKVYKAWAWLANGTQPDGSPLQQGSAFKIDKKSLLELLQGSKSTLARLPKPWVYRVKGGVDVDVAAKYLGYKDGIALIKALIEMPNMKDWITVETEARMQAKFPDPMLDGSVAEEAIKAVHNDRRAGVLAAEMRELRRLMKRDKKIVTATKRDAKTQATAARLANKGTLPKREEMALIKAGAKDTIAKQRYMDVRPEVYLNAERKAGRLAFEANGRGDYEMAYKLKRQQIVNYEMYRAAVRAKEAAAKARNYLTKFNKVKVQQRLGKLGVIDPILAILEGIELKNVTLKAIDRRTALQTLAQQIHDGEIVTPISEFLYHVEHDSKGNEIVVLNEAPFKNWQELTIEDLMALQDIIKQLEHQGKRKLEMPVNGEMVVMEDAALELTEQVLEVNEVVDVGVGTKGTGARVKQAKDSGIAHWLGPSVMANILDKQRWGATTRLVIVTIRRAIAEKLVPMQIKAINDVSALYLKFYSKGVLGWRTKELRQLEKKGFATINGESLSKADVLFIAMNMGNEGNKSAIYNGVRIDGKIAYPEAEVQAALDLLDARDWTFVQAMWDYLDSYWPALSAMEKERRGIAPERVERVPFSVKTSDGETLTLAGGYMPLSYNYEHSERHEDKVFEDHYKNMGNGVYVSANTRAGATHNRVKNHNMVVQLGLFQIEKHLKEITRDIAIGDEVNFVKNLLNNKAYRNAMKVTGNGTALRELNLWLTDAAVGELPANNLIERAAAYTRVGFTVSKLAFNVYTTLLQFTGIFQSMAVIGKQAMMMGAGRVLKNPYTAWTQARDSSKFLQARYGWKSQAFDKDIHDAAGALSEYGPGLPTTGRRVKSTVARAFFWPIAKFQQVVDVTTWWGAIWKARNEMGLSEGEAILFADSEVELAQTSGFFSDRSGIERGTLSNTTRQNQFIRLWTTLISYMQRKGGIAYMNTQDLKNDMGPIKATNYALDLLLLFTVEGIASSMIYGRWDWDEDDPEELLMMALKETGASAMAGIPFVREFATAQYGSGNTPIGGLTNDLFTLYTQALQGDMDPALRKAFVNSMGTLFHLPASQTNRMLEALIDEDDPELLEYLTGTRD